MLQWLHGLWDFVLNQSSPKQQSADAAAGVQYRLPAPKPKRRRKALPPPDTNAEHSASIADLSWVALSGKSHGPDLSFSSHCDLDWSEQCLLMMRSKVQNTGLLRKFTQLSHLRYARHQQVVRRRLFAKYFPIQFGAQTLLQQPAFSLRDTEPFWHVFYIDLDDGVCGENLLSSGLEAAVRWPTLSQIVETKKARLRLDFVTMRDEHIWCAGLIHLLFSSESTCCVVPYDAEHRAFDWTPKELAPASNAERSSSVSRVSRENSSGEEKRAEEEAPDTKESEHSAAASSHAASPQRPEEILPTTQPPSRAASPLPAESLASAAPETQFQPLPLEEMAL